MSIFPQTAGEDLWLVPVEQINCFLMHTLCSCLEVKVVSYSLPLLQSTPSTNSMDLLGIILPWRSLSPESALTSTGRFLNHSHDVCTAAFLTSYSTRFKSKTFLVRLCLCFGLQNIQLHKWFDLWWNFWVLVRSRQWCGLVE